MHASEVVWYVTGRFFTHEKSFFDVGYFLHLGHYDPMFTNASAPSESSAHFTFAAEPFTATPVTNGDLSIALDATGRFSVYFHEKPCATFDDPSTFKKGKRIATFERVSVVAGVTLPNGVGTNAFTARLVESVPFAYGDLRDMIPYAVTQWGTAAGSAHAFIGSAILVG